MAIGSATPAEARISGSITHNAVTGFHTADYFDIETLSLFFSGLSIYNSLELLFLIVYTFSNFSGLYFYSLLISSISIMLYATGSIINALAVTSEGSTWLVGTITALGHYGMVTGQSAVVWSRLHLLIEPGEKGQWTLSWTKWMIIVNAILLGIPTIAPVYESNDDMWTGMFVRAKETLEQIQPSVSLIQEIVLSALFIVAVVRFMKNSMRETSKKFLWQVLGINALVITLNIGLLAIDAAGLEIYGNMTGGTIYSIKLKLEFAVLGGLVSFLGGRSDTSTANEERGKQALEESARGQHEGGTDSETKAGGLPGTDNHVHTTSIDGEAIDLNGRLDYRRLKMHADRALDYRQKAHTVGADADPVGKENHNRSMMGSDEQDR